MQTPPLSFLLLSFLLLLLNEGHLGVCACVLVCIHVHAHACILLPLITLSYFWEMRKEKEGECVWSWESLARGLEYRGRKGSPAASGQDWGLTAVPWEDSPTSERVASRGAWIAQWPDHHRQPAILRCRHFPRSVRGLVSAGGASFFALGDKPHWMPPSPAPSRLERAELAASEAQQQRQLISGQNWSGRVWELPAVQGRHPVRPGPPGLLKSGDQMATAPWGTDHQKLICFWCF